MATMWYYVLQGERKGPVEGQEFISLIQKNVVKPEDYIWKKGFDNWKKLAEVPDLTVYLQASSAPQAVSMVATENAAVDFSAKTGEFKIPSVLTLDWKNIPKDENRFYILVGQDRGQSESQYGPYSLNLLERLYRENRINGKSYIWCQGMENWSMLADLPNFQEIFKAMPPEISDAEKRENLRRPFVARMFFHDNSKLYEGVCRDISTGGMQVLVAGFPGKVGDQISINVHPDNSDYHFVANGKVVRMLEGNMGFSFRFLDLREEAESAIKAYISNENGN